MANDDIPEWALAMASDLAFAENGPPVHYTRELVAFARYIASHEQPPVDPILLRAREIVANIYAERGSPYYPKEVVAGNFDDDPSVEVVIRALKEGMNP